MLPQQLHQALTCQTLCFQLALLPPSGQISNQRSFKQSLTLRFDFVLLCMFCYYDEVSGICFHVKDFFD